jgi:hypothetical protein
MEVKAPLFKSQESLAFSKEEVIEEPKFKHPVFPTATHGKYASK